MGCMSHFKPLDGDINAFLKGGLVPGTGESTQFNGRISVMMMMYKKKNNFSSQTNKVFSL